MRFTILVALRFLFEGRLKSLLIIGGAALGVAVMVFLSSLIEGLQRDLVQKTLGSQAHIVVREQDDRARPQLDRSTARVAAAVERPAQRLRPVPGWTRLLERLEGRPEILGLSPTLTGPALAVRGQAERAVVLRGVDPARFAGVLPIEARMRSGRYSLEAGEVLVGAALAEDLGIGPGDKLRLQTGSGRFEVASVRGLFELRNKAVDASWVLAPLALAQTLLDFPGEVTAIEIKLQDPFEAERIARAVEAETGLRAESWIERNAELMQALSAQGSSSAMIQFFVVLAVALGIASVLSVSVVQKGREIGILKAMGTSTGAITRVFLLQGLLVGLGGSVLGGLLGAGLGLLFQRGATFALALGPLTFVRAGLVASLVGTLAAVVPARRAARLEPAVVIRNG